MATSTRDTATESKFDPSAKLDEMEAAAAAVEARVRERENDYESKRQILEGPDRNLPGLLDEFRDLRTQDPEQFKPDGAPVGEDANSPHRTGGMKLMEREEMIESLEEIIRDPETNPTARVTALRALKEFPQPPALDESLYDPADVLPMTGPVARRANQRLAD